jgi:hypothetical protein
VIANKAIGAIATHDIEVCLTTNEYPDTLTNKCFEVEIEWWMYFDYKLRDGICRNKSATSLMKKKMRGYLGVFLLVEKTKRKVKWFKFTLLNYLNRRLMKKYIYTFIGIVLFF